MTSSPPLKPRFLILTYPAQGHINPSLQFSKRLSSAAGGAPVTFVTTVSAHRRMSGGASGAGAVTHAPFSDGYDDGNAPRDQSYVAELARRGSQALTSLAKSAEAEGRPYTCLIYTILLPWAGWTARELGLPWFLLWIQPATVFDIYYHFFHAHGHALSTIISGKATTTTLPGLPLRLSRRDVPSFFMDDSNSYPLALPLFRAEFELQDEDTGDSKRTILVNTFDELEPEALRALEGVSLTAIGPLIPSAFLDEKDPSDTSFGGDLFKRASDDRVAKWLGSKPRRSVVYVSFGSISVLSERQTEEIARGLLDSGRPFLWVIREGKAPSYDLDELLRVGLIVPWCGQVEVLSSEAVGCFVTHCGWNSTLESLACGVPVVAVPQWTDQGTNAKLAEDVWRTGVRVSVDERDGIVKSGEIKRCLDLVMEGEEFRRNSDKWKGLAREAVREGGSSDRNLKAFVAQVVGEAGRIGG